MGPGACFRACYLGVLTAPPSNQRHFVNLLELNIAVRGLQAVADRWASEQAGVAGVGPFKLGFHSVPSMRQLHLHVISQVRFIQLLAVCQIQHVTQHAAW